MASDDMRERLRAEFEEYDRATMALSNAFGFIDNPAAWVGGEDEYAEIWADAAAAAGNVEMAAEALGDGARKIAAALELALDEAEARRCGS